ncbi:MAG TPA: phosphoenolpyruvate synthase [Gammaproteobacteria bacterium]|nr:phosphoenolpyruvate synthase [Gammaproteobacteria bacterium]
MDKLYVIGFEQLGMSDVDKVGGKNASLGEMLSHLTQLGVLVPNGFATTANAYREFIAHDGLAARISKELASLNVDDVVKLAETGTRIRQWIAAVPYPANLEQAIRASYAGLIQQAGKEFSVAVRSSATAEDLPDASFAGQQETVLNVRGIDQVLQAVKEVFASLYNDRAIAYRVHHGFEHAEVALSAGIQRMVRSDLGASGVLFTLDTESGFDKVVFITAAYGLGETVVQGTVNPDEFYVYKPSLATGKYPIVRRSLGSKSSMMIYGDGKSKSHTVKTIEVHAEARMRFSINDAEVITLAKQALIIEKHYARPMDVEWAKDGTDGKLYILQARPETVKSRRNQRIERYTLKARGPVLVEGRSIGQKIGAGTAKIIQSIKEMNHIKEGDVLVTDMTDPDWEPIMKRAAAIVTNRGGRTCHAAIIARELGIPAVVGCGDATHKVKDGQTVTVSCAEGDTGHIYAGKLDFEHREINVDHMPKAPLKIMMNVGNPERAFGFAMLPNKGVGLARLEFIINRMIGIHPKALINFETQPVEIKHQIQERIAGYRDPVSFYVERLAEGIATIAAAFAPEPVIVRTSDFKSNEYANLIGGRQYEPHEENPMLGFRGASRYIAEDFRDCFELECRALRKVRDDMGFDNVQVMIPFVRTVEEARQVTELLSANGLKRGDNGLKVIMMCELPSNAVLAEQFLQYFDGFSIGSNDMTQLTLGLDRDSGVIAHLFDERNDAVKSLLSMAIQACRKHKKYIGICGQGPSDHPDLARWLLDQGIESISLNPDTVLETWLYLAGEAK